jgi:hypothetical protein
MIPGVLPSASRQALKGDKPGAVMRKDKVKGAILAGGLGTPLYPFEVVWINPQVAKTGMGGPLFKASDGG